MNISYSGIIKKRRVPEANVQAEFYMACRKRGIPVLLEITYERCRFDALVFHNDKPVAIVEVKNYAKGALKRGLKPNSRQVRKYSKYGIPIIPVLATSHIMPAINSIAQIIESQNEVRD